jgi:hypothetical protein
MILKSGLKCSQRRVFGIRNSGGIVSAGKSWCTPPPRAPLPGITKIRSSPGSKQPKTSAGIFSSHSGGYLEFISFPIYLSRFERFGARKMKWERQSLFSVSEKYTGCHTQKMSLLTELGILFWPIYYKYATPTEFGILVRPVNFHFGAAYNLFQLPL